MNLDRHHRRIRAKTRALHWSLWPLALLAAPAALYFGYGVCEEADSAATFAACRAFQIVPFLPSLAGLAILGLIAWDLAAIGGELHYERHGVRKRDVHHAVHGYLAIDERHRRHVRWALVHLLAFTVLIAAWLAYESYVSTH
jgi:hypothetical protein